MSNLLIKRVCFLVSLLGCAFYGRAQLLANYSTTPDIATVAKYVDFPSANYTGIVPITVPLYEIKLKDYTFPISLDYHARGIQVNELASSIGLGWTLNATGVISRVVRGEPDDFNKARVLDPNIDFLEWVPRIGRFWADNATRIKNFDPDYKNMDYVEKEFKEIAGSGHTVYSYYGKSDMEPDLFYFNCNGISGNFVFDVNDNGTQRVRLIPQQDVSILHSLDGEGRIKSFAMRDSQGNRYSFNTIEKLEHTELHTSCMYDSEREDDIFSMYQTTTEYNAAWYLTRIDIPGGNYMAFEYDNEDYHMLDQLVYSFRAFNHHGDANRSWGNDISKTKKRISRITTPDQEITFTPYSTTREDLKNCYAIKEMKVKLLRTNQIKEQLQFKHSYLVSPNEVNPNIEMRRKEKNKRLKLDGIENKLTKESHTFHYNPTLLPATYSFQQDLWGFFNGAAQNKHLMPSIWFYPEKTGPERFSLYHLGDHYEWIYNKGAIREASPNRVMACMLTGITHPTGKNRL
ncbi:MAG: hypothetical protein LUE93_16460 [Bacteroides sp.]|nr:hypothetical protein [Bacteroides sp.]